MSAPWHCPASPDYHHRFEWQPMDERLDHECVYCLVMVNGMTYKTNVYEYAEAERAKKNRAQPVLPLEETG